MIHTCAQKRTKSILALLVSMLFVCMLPLVLHAQSSERIQSFVVDIEVQQNADVWVTEHITYEFPNAKHGIYRCIPTLHAEQPESPFKERYIDVIFESVTMDGTDVLYTREQKGKDTCVRIGDPDTTIEGSHVYALHYVVEGTLSYLEYGGAELYWNATGNEWEVPIVSAEVRVRGAEGLLLRERACYRGAVGDESSCDMRIDTDGTPIFTARLLNPGEGVTVAQALNRSSLLIDVRERYGMLWKILAFVVTVLCAFSIGLYRYKTKEKTEAPIIPQYEPYPGVKPMYAGYLFDSRLDPRDITAGIVYLAEQGFLSIKKTETKVLFVFEVNDFALTLKKPLAETRDNFESQLLTLIFGTDAVVGAVVTLSDLRNTLSVQTRNRAIIRNMTEGLRNDMKAGGFYTGFSFVSMGGRVWVVSGFISCILAILISREIFIATAVFMLIVFVVLIDGRRTKKGYEALDHLKGFKDFLQVTDAQRFIFHNAPAINAEHFMEYLPYAIAFGVEKEWAKTFEGVTIPNPSWYDGGSGAGTFNAVALTQSLGGFSTAFASASGASASSGGGSSGGGSGGGGGGSW